MLSILDFIAKKVLIRSKFAATCKNMAIFAYCETDLNDLHIESSYTLPVASPLILGGVKIGNNIHISDDGTITADIDLSGILESIQRLTEVTEGNTRSINSLETSKQDNLISGTNIKTINGLDILGEGNIEIKGGSSYLSSKVFSTNIPKANNSINYSFSVEVN